MRHFISAFCITLLQVSATGGVVQAAVLPLDPVPYPPVETDNWTGGYLGLHGSKIFSDGRIELDKYSGTLIPLDVDNGLFFKDKEELRGTLGGGLTVGYNQQFGSMVIGAEADITFMSLDVKHNRSRIDPNPIFPFTGQTTLSEYKTGFDNLGTLRLRAGYSFNKTLVYLTGGVAAAEVSNSFGIALPGLGYSSPDWSVSGLEWGYVVGAGVEHKLTHNMSVKGEVLFVDLEDTVVNGRDPVTFPGEHISYKFDNELIVGRVGVNIAF